MTVHNSHGRVDRKNNLWVKEQKCLTAYRRGNEVLESQSTKLNFLNFFSESVEPSSRNRDQNMTKNQHVYAICCRPEVAGDAFAGANVKTIEGYPVANFAVASSNSFRDIKKFFS